MLGNYDITEVELDRHFRDEAKFKKALEKSVADIPGRITADLIGSMISGKPVSAEEGYQRWKDDHPELLGKFPDTPVLEAAKRFYNDTAAQLAPYGKQIRELNDYLAWKTGQTSQSSESTGPGADERREQLLDNLATMPQELRDLIFPAIVDGAQRLGALDDKGVGTQFYELIGRNINIASGAALNAKEFAAEAELDRLKAGTPLFRTPDGRLLDSPRYLRAGPLAQPLTDEQRAARIAKTEHSIARLGLDRQLEDLATNGYDAVRNRHTGILGFLETGLYGTASSAGYTAVAMIPVAGPYLAMSAAMSDTYTDLKLKYPKAKSSDLRRVAVVSGAIQGALELFKARAIFGRVPALEKAMNRWANPAFVGGAQRAGKRLVTTLAAENAMEAAQDLTTPLVQDVCAALGADIPWIKWEDIFYPFAEARPETFAALVPMVVLGVFGISMHENRRLQSQPERLKIWQSVGFNSEQIAKIERGATVEEKQAKARELINQRTPEAIKEGIRMVEAEQDAVNAKHFDPERTKNPYFTLAGEEQLDEDSKLESTLHKSIVTDALTEPLLSEILAINVEKGDMNCISCAIATDDVLSGKKSRASVGPPDYVFGLEDKFSSKFSDVDGPNQIAEILLSTGANARGIVFGIPRGGRRGHVFNAINLNSQIYFLDGQTGRNGLYNFKRFDIFLFLLTHPRVETLQ